MELTLSDIQAILKYELTEQQYGDKLVSGVSSHLEQVLTPATATSSSAKPIMTGSHPGIIAELKRRHVFRVGIGYVVIAWIVLQIADVFFPALNLPYWTVRLVAGLLVLGFPIALFLAWAYELTSEGMKPTHTIYSDDASNQAKDLGISDTPMRPTRRKVAVLITVGVVAIGVTLFAVERTRTWMIQAALDIAFYAAKAFPYKLERELSIAVLPFVNMSSDKENTYFSDGISEEILNALVQTNRMPVIARTSSFQFKGSNLDLMQIGSALNVTHILEGSVRKSDRRVRITAQVNDAITGVQLWSNTYDGDLRDVLGVQREIATSIVNELHSLLKLQASQDVTTAYSCEVEQRFLSIVNA